MIKARWPRLARRTEDASPRVPVSIESKLVEGNTVTLEIAFGDDFWEKLDTFLRQKLGHLNEREAAEAVALLLDYGVPEENTARELTMAEKFALGAGHSSLKFQMFECFQANRAIAVGLAVNLPHNRSLKKRLAELRGAEAVPHNDWDSWDDAKINEYQNRYLFVK